jgi:hypothetical protein
MTTAFYCLGMLAAHMMTFFGGILIGWTLRGRADGP